MRRALPVGIVLSALIFYAATLAPGLLWGDSAKFQRMAWQLDLRFDETGHPLWVLLAHPFTRIPGLDPAKACNLLSAALSALALWPAFRVMRRLGASSAAASLACLSLAVSHTWWLHAVVAEVYALNSLVTLVLLDLITSAVDGTQGPPAGKDRAVGASRPAGFWLAVGVALGLGAGNHLMVLLWWPGLAVWVISAYRAGRVKLAGVGLAAAGALAALAPFTILGWGLPRTESLPALIERLVLRVLHPGLLGRDALQCAAYLLYQFPVPLMLIAAAAGARALWRRRRIDLAGLLVLLSANLAFALSHQVPDRFAFLLPCYLLLAIMAAPGLDALRELFAPPARAGSRLIVAAAAACCIAAPPAVYRMAPALIGPAVLARFPSARQLPGRDPVQFHLDPCKRGVDGAARFSRAALEPLPAGSVLIADYTLHEPLDYTQVVDRLRPDVEVRYVQQDKQLRYALAQTEHGRAVFLAADDSPYDIAGLTTRFDIRRSGPIYAVVPKEPPRTRD